MRSWLPQDHFELGLPGALIRALAHRSGSCFEEKSRTIFPSSALARSLHDCVAVPCSMAFAGVVSCVCTSIFARFLLALAVDGIPLQELLPEPVPVSADDQVVPVPQHLQELAGGLQLCHRGAVLVDDEGPLPLALGVGLPRAPF